MTPTLPLVALLACVTGADTTALIPLGAPAPTPVAADASDGRAAPREASAPADPSDSGATREDPPEAETAPEGDPEDDLGRYEGSFCPDALFIVTEDISRADALANCELNAVLNPDRSVRCTWNGEEILRREVTPGDCDSAPGDAPAETTSDDAAAGCWRMCVDAAWPGLIACLDAGGGDTACHDAFYADVYACGGTCDAPADGAGDAPADDTPADDAGDAPPDDTRDTPADDAGGAPPDDTRDAGDAPAEDPLPADGTCLPDGFAPAAFEVPQDGMSCDGPGSIRYDARQGLWVGIVACAPGTFRFYLSRDAAGPYLPAMDVAGHGQDHCELVDPGFTLGNEDDITSGSCPDCATGWNLPLEGVAGWYRAFLGEPFQYVDATGPWSYQVSQVTCGCGRP
ncbi:MAG: hypothetical protein RLZZ299_194 [Pseudomonadota bacterium]|jgi:hypothetical protein